MTALTCCQRSDLEKAAICEGQGPKTSGDLSVRGRWRCVSMAWHLGLGSRSRVDSARDRVGPRVKDLGN